MLTSVKKKLIEHGFVRDEKGSIIVFVMVVFSAMFLVGGTAVDLARHENLRSSLQYNLDRAVLAAASLKQTQDPDTVVQDYMSRIKAIENFTVTVTSEVAVNSRSVSATANATLDTWFLSMAGIEDMPISAKSSAQEKIPNLEISLVLDVSGSMRNNSKLANLKTAAKEFVTTMLTGIDPDTVAISIVPFNHNVAPSTELYDAITTNGLHEYSTCLEFADSDFNSVKIDPAVSQTQAVYTSLYGGWQDVGGWSITCYSDDYFEIMAYSDNKTALHNKIDSFQADGNTAGHLGLKWGLALLDPAFQPVVTSFIDSSLVDEGFAGIPVNYSDTQTLKVVIMMGDGANTTEFRANDNYSDDTSDLYKVDYTSEVFEYAYKKNKVWRTSTSQSKCSNSKWVCVYSSESFTDYYLRKTSNNQYLDIDSNQWLSSATFGNLPSTLEGWTSTEQLSWGDAWGQMAVEFYDDKTGNNADYVFDTSSGRNGTEADTVMTSACNAARNTGIIVYTIGFETNTTTSGKLRDCASTDSHYYNAAGTQISAVFAAIAASIQKLKLTQ